MTSSCSQSSVANMPKAIVGIKKMSPNVLVDKSMQTAVARLFRKINGRGYLAARGRLKIFLLLESEKPCVDIGREPKERCVITLRSFIESHAFDGDSIFGSLQLALQCEEILV